MMRGNTRAAIYTTLSALLVASLIASASNIIDTAVLKTKVANQKEMIEKIYEIVLRIEEKI